MKEERRSLKHGTALKTKLLTDTHQPGRLGKEFFTRDVLEVAPDLIGKYLYTGKYDDHEKHMITEVEAYRGEEDLACHACRGRTARTGMLYSEGGVLYIYLIYGVYWMLNIVTGKENEPQAVLVRGVDSHKGPGRVTRALGINKSYNGEDLSESGRIWIGESGVTPPFKTGPRIGVDYAGEYWKSMPWRYYVSR
jgi:DNA-3-methyladenine glycosylase